MQVTYVGPFNPDNGRNRSIIRGLRAAGLEVDIANSNSRSRSIRYARCAQRGLASGSDVLIYGARGTRFGQPLSLVMSLVKRRTVVFDAVLSLYETFVIDRKHHAVRSPAAKLMHMLDRKTFASCDIILSDTNEHAKYYSSEFGVPLSKFETIYIGTDDSVFYPRPRKTHESFEVGFWGAYVPLQGVETIVEAASRLKDRNDIAFRMNGRGQMFPKAKTLADEKGLRNMQFVQEWVSYEELPAVINEFDVCLGIFGSGSKSMNVIPNKVYEGLAMAKPVITADTPAARELLMDRKNCLLVPPDDADALGDAILKLKEDSGLRESIASGGYELFKSSLAPAATGRRLASVLTECAERTDRRE